MNVEEFVRDLAEHGVRFDLNPTIDISRAEGSHLDYLQRIDASIRERAAAALGGVSPVSPTPVVDAEQLRREIFTAPSLIAWHSSDLDAIVAHVMASGIFRDAAVVVAAEREACAQVVEKADVGTDGCVTTRRLLAALLRARTETDPLAAHDREVAARALDEMAEELDIEHIEKHGCVSPWSAKPRKVAAEYRAGERS